MLTNLLFSIAKDVNYEFDREQLKKGCYSPVAHERLEREWTEFRQTAIDVFSGKTCLKIFAVDQKVTEVNSETMPRVDTI